MNATEPSDTLPLYTLSIKPQGSSAAVGVVGLGNARAITLPAPSCSRCYCCWLCCCLSGVTFARGVGRALAPVPFGSPVPPGRSPQPHRPLSGCAAPGAWGMYALKPVRRGGMMGSGATLPQLRARKVVFIPLLIPQPDWDKSH